MLDEPTAVLPHDEVERLFGFVREGAARRDERRYVSHRMDEIFELADRVTVLRGGRVVTTVPAREVDHHSLAASSSVRTSIPTTTPVVVRPDEPVVLGCAISRRWLRREPGGPSWRILGIAGLAGAGIHELPYAIAGSPEYR